MFGERLFCNKYGQLQLPEGGYGRDLHGRWWCRPFNESVRRQLDVKFVIEHADGTITARGVINGGLERYTLQRGLWHKL